MSQYLSRNKALILLEDGTVFHGKSIGIEGQAFGELCFNTRIPFAKGLLPQ